MNILKRLVGQESGIGSRESGVGVQSPESAHFRTLELPHARTSHPRRGVALLIVLGLLGLLLISAVGFAVLMRTERSAATNYRHTSSARQILFAALNRAIEDLDTDISSSLNPDWTADPFYLSNGKRMVRNPEKVLFSYYDNPAGEEPVFARILTKDVMTYIPALFHRRLNQLDNEFDGDIGAPDPSADSSCHPEWVPINHNGSVIGRYAYAIIDTAGLLDASLVCDPDTNRWMGASLREVRLDPDIVTVKDIKSVADFQADRKLDGRYETIAELAALNTGLDRTKLSNFEVFSTYSTTVWTNIPPVNLYGITKATELATNKPAILAAFKASGVPDFGALMEPSTIPSEEALYYALADYVDSDSVMEGTYVRPCTEQVPMVNSFGITMTYSRQNVGDVDGDGNPDYTHTIEHAPFLNFVDWPVDRSRAKDLPFMIRGAFKIYNPNVGLVNKDDREEGVVKIFDYGIAPGEAKSDICIADEYPLQLSGVSGSENNLLGVVIPASSDPTVEGTAPRLKFKIYVAFEVYNKNGDLCYQFPSTKYPNLFKAGLPDDSSSEESWAVFNVDVNFQGGNTQSVWFECVDPRVAFRFGGDPKGQAHWYANTLHTDPEQIRALSEIGGYTPPPSGKYSWDKGLQVQLLKNPAIATDVGLNKHRVDSFHLPDFDGDGKEYDDPLKGTPFRMHAANAPLQTPGELAYLLFGAWETIRIYDHYPSEPPADKFHKVLDYFEVRNPTAVPKGKVNLNSAPEDVLSLLFLDMPLRTEEKYKPAAWIDKDAAAPLVQESNLAPALGGLLYASLAAVRPVNSLSQLSRIYGEAANPVPGIQAWLNSRSAFLNPNLGEFEREAVIRNVVNLLTTKQQIFTIVLRADAFTTRFGSDKLKDGTVLSSAIAVAQVTRDPIPTGDSSVTPARPYHKTTVRMLKILE